MALTGRPFLVARLRERRSFWAALREICRAFVERVAGVRK